MKVINEIVYYFDIDSEYSKANNYSEIVKNHIESLSENKYQLKETTYLIKSQKSGEEICHGIDETLVHFFVVCWVFFLQVSF